MSIYETLHIGEHAIEIIERDLKVESEKKLIAQILDNYHVRGLIVDETDEVIAVTELIVLANCLRKTNTQNGSTKT